MKQPKMSDLRVARVATRLMRARMAKVQKIKITINLDADLLSQIRQLSEKRGTPYQTYLNRLLRETLAHRRGERSRLDRLERELAGIKKKLAA